MSEGHEIKAKERALWRRISQRVRASRASAMLEFALVMPIFAMIVSAMIEFTALWDAKILANHTAWTVGRIMTVRAGQRDPAKSTSLLGKKPKNIIDALRPGGTGVDGAYVATALLMSTCSMGSMHGSASEFSKDYITGWIKEGTTALKNYLKGKITAGIKEAVKNVISSIAGESMGDSAIAKKIGEAISKIAGGVADAIAEAITSSITSLIPQSIYDAIGNFLNGTRQIRQLAYAADRVARYNVVKVTERDDIKIPAFGKGSMYGSGQLEFPASFDKNAKNDGWMVTHASGWPPMKQVQKMVDVKIAWPFERAWMFPVLSTDGKADIDKVPTAVGRSLFYPQPAIFNENLSSTNPKAFDPGNTNSVLDVAKELQAQYANFLKMVKFAYEYRLCYETIGPYDSYSKESFSYKGIGYPVKGETDSDSIKKLDGLVVWMERAPDNPKNHLSWERKRPPADYLKCFEQITGTRDEACKFWHGVAFAALKTAALESFENRAYGKKEWFYWGNDTNLHLRYWHYSPPTLPLALKRDDMCSNPPFRWYSLLLKDDLEGLWPKRLAVDNAALIPDSSLYHACCAEFNEGVSQSQWSKFTIQNRDFGAKWSAITSFYAGKSTLEALTERENIALQRALVQSQKQEDVLRKFVSASHDEVANTLGDGEVDISEDSFFDFDGEDEEIMKDPSKAVEKMKEKLEKLKTKLHVLLRRIDVAESDLRYKSVAMSNVLFSTGIKREESVKRWIGTVSCAMQMAQSENPDDVAAAIRAHLPAVTGDFESSTKLLEVASEQYRDAYIALYNAELEYANALGLKSARKKTPLEPGNDPKFKPDEPPDPSQPTESSSQSGSDDDKLGDFWKHGKDGWRRDHSGEEDR